MMLYVVIADVSPLINAELPVAKRIVQIELTAEQSEKIQLRGQYESVSEAILEVSP